MRKFFLALIAYAVMLVLAVPSYAAIIDLGVAYDTTVMYQGSIDQVYYGPGSAADVNFDAAQTLLAYQYYENHASSFLQFDLSSLAGSTVNNAALYLDINGAARHVSNTLIPQVGAHQVNTNWDSSLLTWNDVYSGSVWAPEIRDNFYTESPFAIDSWLAADTYPNTMSFDMTDIVNSWLQGDLDNNGVAITGIKMNEPHGTGFYSSESVSYPPHYPYLRIDYTLNGDDPNVVPEPATLLLLGSGLMGLAGMGRKRVF